MTSARRASAALLVAAALLGLAGPGIAAASSAGQADADRGAAAFRAGDYRAARDAFREAVRRDLRHAEAWHGLGWAEYRLGNEGEALRIWRDLLRVAPDRTDTREAVASVERERERRARAPVERERAEREAAQAAARDDVAAERRRVAQAREREGARRERLRAAVARGDAALRDGDAAAAEREYRAALAEAPDNPRLVLKVGEAVRRGGRVEEAIELWLGASRAPGAPPDLFRYLGDAYASLGDDERARASYRRAVEATPSGQPAALLRLADLDLAVGDVAEAERSLAALLAIPGIDAGWAERVAELLVRHRAYERGVALLEGAAPPLPGRERALARLHRAAGDAALRAGDPDAAAGAFSRALAHSPDSPVVLRGLGLALRRAGRPDEAEEPLRRYARALPGRAEPHDLLAALALDRHAYEDALAESRKSLTIDPASRGARIRLVRSLLGLGRIREARSEAGALAAQRPDDVQALHLLALSLTRSRAFAEAARQWRRVLELDPRSSVAKQNWVRALHESGDAEAAVAAATVLAAEPEAPPPVLELLAEDARARGALEEALRWYQELSRRFPGELKYWRSSLLLLDELGRFEEQVVVAEAAARRLPDRSELQLELATALGNAGRLPEAIARMRRFLEVFPDNRDAFLALVDLLRRAGRTSDALAVLSRNQPGFYKDYERVMVEASLRATRRDFRSATRLLRRVANAGPEQRFVPVLVYHGIVAHPRTVQTPAAAFEAQIAALAAGGYQPITLVELARMIDGRAPFPERPILITFDDARTDSFELADPILERYGFKATMFVPTARIQAEDSFHAGWGTIVRYAATGRWDVQAHGHEAHGPVAVDAQGNGGEFLAYRRWLPEGRAETTAEFLARVDDDHERCKAAIERELPGHPVLGYAFPLNQVALSQRWDGDALGHVNERLASRHFRFGFVQDDSGYNRFVPGGDAPFLIRRFEVPGEWTGEDLLAHLARRDPVRAARLELARVALAEGRPRAARRIVQDVAREEPLVGPEAEQALAQIDWEENRPRSAAAHLATAPVGGAPGADALRTRLAWRNRTRAGLEGFAFADSDRRAFASAGTTLRLALPREVDVDLHLGQVLMTERDARSISGPELGARGSAALGGRLDVTGWARFRELSGPAGSSLNGGVGLRLRVEQHAIGLRLSAEDVDTVLAQQRGIGFRAAAGTYAFVSPRWRAEAQLTWSELDDGNRRNDLEATVLRRVGARGQWFVGGALAFQDSRFDPPEYWAPRELFQATARVGFRHAWRDAGTLAADAGLGGAHDPAGDLRPTAFARLRLSRWWGAHRRIGTTVELSGRALPRYQSLGTVFRLELRF